MRLSAANAIEALEVCASPTSFHHDDYRPDCVWFNDEFVDKLVTNIVALTGTELEYVDEPVPSHDIEPMVERPRKAREARAE